MVGGGPAGSSAARAAAGLGLRVVLLEMARHPRYKACGGALSEQARFYLDFSLPQEVVDAEVCSLRVSFGRKSIVHDAGRRLSTMVTRSAFDHLLLEKAAEAGAEVLTGRRVRRVREADGAAVADAGEELRGSFVLIAEGYRGRLMRSVRPDLPDERGFCLVAEVAGRCQFPGLDIQFGGADMGYGWIFPHRHFLSVGIGGLASRLADPKTALEVFLRSNNLSFSGRLHGHPIPLAGPSMKLVKGRMLLAGDAAGFVDPFTGEGIAYAIRSGQLAARTVAEALADGISLDSYRHLCWSEFGSDLRFSLFMTRLMHRHPQRLFPLFIDHPELLERYLKIPGSQTGYRDFLTYLAWRLPGLLIRRWNDCR